VLPGSYLSRNVTLADGSTMNPGAGYVRIALVAEPERIGEAAERIRNFALSRK
jgi:N-succinyldiaminopimelate aminotransferase